MATQATAASTPSHAAEETLSRGMMGMVLFLGSEIMLFGGLFAGYFFVRNQAVVWPPEGSHELEAVLGGVLTAILVLSGLVAHIGIVGARSNNNSLFLLGMAGAIILGTIFIAGQAYEWLNLMDEGLTADSGVYGSTFYVLTGFHGAHVSLGVICLIFVYFRAARGAYTAESHAGVEVIGLYWHFVDLVWIILFTIVYLI